MSTILNKVNPEIIIFDKECYPRVDGIDNEHLNLLRNAKNLPPITVNQDMLLIEGRHRLTLALMEKRSEIEVKVENVPKEKILERAAQLNARYGKQLSLRDKQHVVRKLSQNGYNTAKLASLLSVSTRLVNKWTSDIRETQTKDRNAQILDLYLMGYTEAEIGKKIGHIKRSQIYNIIAESKKGTDSKIGLPDQPQIGDVWLFSGCDDAYGLDGYPGRIPGQILENLLHLYTDPFDLVVDPMAGGGTTLDVCKAMYRRCLAYDIKVVREEVRENDIVDKGLPPRARGADLIVLDPPYYKKKEEQYSEKSISSLGREAYLEVFKRIAKTCYRATKIEGHLSLIISNFVDEQNPKESIWVWEYLTLFKQAGFIPIREIQCPLTTQSLHPSDALKFQEAKRMAKLTRSIIVFQKQGKHAA